MNKRLMDKIYSSNLDFEIKKEHIEEVEEKIKIINHRRMRIFGIVTMIIELALILFFDIPNRNKSVYSKDYLFSHISIFIISIIIVNYARKFKKNPKKRIYNYLPSLSIFSFMLFMAFIGYLDQIMLGNVVSYITMLFLVGIVIFIKPPRNYIIYTIPQILLVTLILKNLQITPESIGSIVNSTIFLMCMLVVSKIIYENQLAHLLKNIVLVEINEKLKHVSNFDSLTNLPNRRYFEELVKKVIENNRKAEKNSVIAIMDVDFFKKTNDAYGHNIGDLVLKEISKIIKINLSSENLVARWGGEEFIFFLPDTTIEEAEVLLNRLREKIKVMLSEVQGHRLNITASFGLTKFLSGSDEEYIKAFSLADEALYKAKNEGRDRVIKM